MDSGPMRVVRWLGSVNFAIMLIALAILAVILGTTIEAQTGSHKTASRLIYTHPLFLLVLWGFFLNILCATLKRAPFSKHHIPFIITHIGLLMVISGSLLKYSFGLQGTITLKEGMRTEWVVLDDTWAISLLPKNSTTWHQIPLERDRFGRLKMHYAWNDLAVDIRGLAPHGEEKIETWIKDQHLSILGEPPIPLEVVTKIEDYTVIAAEDPEVVKKALKTLPALVFLNEPSGLTIFEVGEEVQMKEPRLYAYDDGRLGFSAALQLGQKELETLLTRKHLPKTLPRKAEEERPLIALTLKEGGSEEKVALAFQSPYPQGVFNGQYLMQFEPQRAPLPQEIRLQVATATRYPNTTQPASYTARLLAGTEKVTLSMNQVWESPQGWRFYLANLSPLDETNVKQVRLVVNHDPFKYYLTYPGAALLALGILLLFCPLPLFRKI